MQYNAYVPGGQGRYIQHTVQLSEPADTQAREMMVAGWGFDIEVLSTTERSLTCHNDEIIYYIVLDNDGVSPTMSDTAALEVLVAGAHEQWMKHGKPDAREYGDGSEYH